jgi:two-component system cell cycle sensor histidine kinase/response regulator CckA
MRSALQRHARDLRTQLDLRRAELARRAATSAAARAPQEEANAARASNGHAGTVAAEPAPANDPPVAPEPLVASVDAAGELTIRTANISERESARLGHAVMEPGEYVLCEVSDTGTGISPDVMDKIFEPFFSTKDVGKGTGLGLSTVYGIVKQTGGFIFAKSEVGSGTVFRIYLPRCEEALAVPAPAEKRAKKEREGKDLTGSATVLLVEDEDAVRSFAARALTTRGYKVLEASSGAHALEVMNEHQADVDIVVSDVVMPEMDGPTMLKHLRKTNPNLKIIFMSGYAEDAFRNGLSEDDASTFAFLPKPFSLKVLAEKVKDILEEN